jgi:hypothetical protein
MSMFENDQYRWRETYFVLFESAKRPALKVVRKRLAVIKDNLELVNPQADEHGAMESMTVLAPDDFAALDISYLSGDEVVEQAQTLVKELKTPECRGAERAKVERLARCDARFDILHFEQLTDAGEAEEVDEMLDPSALLLVLEVLAELTGGIAIDPQSGAMI